MAFGGPIGYRRTVEADEIDFAEFEDKDIFCSYFLFLWFHWADCRHSIIAEEGDLTCIAGNPSQ